MNKKIVGSAILALAACSCTQTNIDKLCQTCIDSSSPLAIEVVAAVDSRVVVTDDWAMEWEGDDALLGYSLASSQFDKFRIAEFDGGSASFVGGNVANSYRVVYPYVADATSLYRVDLSEQSAGAKSTYMISEQEVSVDNPAAIMKHVGAMMTLNVLGVDDLAGYRLSSIELEGMPTVAEINLGGDLALDERSGTYGATSADAPMLINVDEEIIVAAGIAPQIRCNILPFTLAKGEAITANVNFVSPTGYEASITASVVNTTANDVAFERAKYHTLNLICQEGDVQEMLFTPAWDDEFYQYVSPMGTKRVDIVEDYGAPTDGVSNASSALQAAIDEMSANGGGEVYIPAGQFCVKNISMRSNVTILVEAGTTIKPMYPADAESKLVTQMFFFYNTDGTGAILDNVQMIGLGGRFNVELDKRVNQTLSAKVFLFGSVKNFRVSNVNISDVDTSYPMFTFNPTAQNTVDPESGKIMMGPINGVVSHARVDNCHYGYGLVQVQAGENLHFEKLSGVGGITLRCETGAQGMNNSQWGGIFDITGKDIYCKNGNAAAMVSPHAMHNGDVAIEHIIAESCGMGVRLEGGYISDKDDEGLITKPGTYENVKVSKIYARYGVTAQLKAKHYGYLPDELHSLCSPTVNKVSEPAPSIAAVVQSMFAGEDAKTVTIEDVVALGYITPPVLSCSWADYIAGQNNK